MSAVLAVLGFNEQDVGESENFGQLGIDSMQVVEVRTNLQRALGRPFPLDEVRHVVPSRPLELYSCRLLPCFFGKTVKLEEWGQQYLVTLPRSITVTIPSHV